MGEVVFAAVCAHVPPLVTPQGVRDWLSPDHPTTLIDGMHKMREALDATNPDTFFIIDTHWLTTSNHIMDGAEHHNGVFTSDEVPLLINNVEYDYPGAPELGDLIVQAAERDGLVNRVHNYKGGLPKHYGTLNLLKFLHSDQKVLSVGHCQNADPHNFDALGRYLGEAVKAYNGRVAILASGGMSHMFHEFDSVFEPQNRTFNPSGIYSATHRDLDYVIIDHWKNGNHAAVLDLIPQFMTLSPEGEFSHYMIMAGALGGRECTLKGTPYSSYENMIGTGQIHMVFKS